MLSLWVQLLRSIPVQCFPIPRLPFHPDEPFVIVGAVWNVWPTSLVFPSSKETPPTVLVDQGAKTDYVGQTHGNNGQRPLTLHPLEVCESRPGEVVFKNGDGFRNRDEAPDRDYDDAIVEARSVNARFRSETARHSLPYLYPMRKTPGNISLLVLLACSRQSMGNGMRSMQRSIKVLGIAVPRNQGGCEKQWPQLTVVQDFSTGTHWNKVEKNAARSQAALKAPTTRRAT